MQIKYISATPSRSTSLLRKSVAAVTTVAVAGVALMFSAVLLSVVLVTGAMAFAYLWWKMRALRKQMQQQMQGFTARNASMQYEGYHGEVIEGEVVRTHQPGHGAGR